MTHRVRQIAEAVDDDHAAIILLGGSDNGKRCPETDAHDGQSIRVDVRASGKQRMQTPYRLDRFVDALFEPARQG